MGTLCGYAAVPPGHPLHGANESGLDIEVHGGLTYANTCAGAVCHVPEPGQPDAVWWFGFDCGHWADVVPSMPHTAAEPGVYRDLAYVQEEVENLASQLLAAGIEAARRPVERT
jgi:hypothetical protein